MIDTRGKLQILLDKGGYGNLSTADDHGFAAVKSVIFTSYLVKVGYSLDLSTSISTW